MKVDRRRLTESGSRYEGGVRALNGTIEEVRGIFERRKLELAHDEEYDGIVYVLGVAADVDENGNVAYFNDDIGVWEKIVPGFDRLEVHKWNGERIV